MATTHCSIAFVVLFRDAGSCEVFSQRRDRSGVWVVHGAVAHQTKSREFEDKLGGAKISKAQAVSSVAARSLPTQSLKIDWLDTAYTIKTN